ncbi:ATP-dependent Clp protease adaptor ClpS [Mesohalobacter halotolerans]|jgi:ATP-dependent Clp protease adaptor protein ClpS|uniref:ATP-dependent Clp protease adaptor ClpS n=1 Tax=Mesohalobacter halotolerans TaxID=1883405 RepID=A0A4U5TTR5_9FLAO|nr:ATP-dependent Clp protease adaptor ClpS [Mesohalobacter halotolerans]MBS3738596.1 ATP-dependent Clp protease adaptor ClpS [Psychroflexus sp.]NBC56667.1 ATP-dependent Clp protease adaptor ClpS [Bacteroidota bacterium]TKS57281.1 ATP-dependent Clp protease adaptor ClpS [Mesohalobacter halotolerans]
MSQKEQIQDDVIVEEQVSREHEIIVYNDEVNTFDHVIDTLIKACDHNPIQAEQCTLIIHYNGKCAVKSGEFKDLKPRCSKILDEGINAEII